MKSFAYLAYISTSLSLLLYVFLVDLRLKQTLTVFHDTLGRSTDLHARLVMDSTCLSNRSACQTQAHYRPDPTAQTDTLTLQYRKEMPASTAHSGRPASRSSRNTSGDSMRSRSPSLPAAKAAGYRIISTTGFSSRAGLPAISYTRGK